MPFERFLILVRKGIQIVSFQILHGTSLPPQISHFDKDACLHAELTHLAVKCTPVNLPRPYLVMQIVSFIIIIDVHMKNIGRQCLHPLFFQNVGNRRVSVVKADAKTRFILQALGKPR